MRQLTWLLQFALVVTLIGNCKSALSQTSSGESNGAENFISNCEGNSAMLDLLASELGSSNERAFIIARLGCGEVSREFNRRRLYNVRTYLEINRNSNLDRMLFAEGDRVEKEGRVEFYLGSRLLFASLVRRGEDICVTCCDLNPAYYGMGKRDKLKRKRR